MSFTEFNYSHIKGSRKFHEIIGVYKNGDIKRVPNIPDEAIEDEIKYNRENRFGRAMFVNMELIYTGYLSEQECYDALEKHGMKNTKMVKVLFVTLWLISAIVGYYFAGE